MHSTALPEAPFTKLSKQASTTKWFSSLKDTEISQKFEPTTFESLVLFWILIKGADLKQSAKHESKKSLLMVSFVSIWLVKYIPLEKGPDHGTKERFLLQFGTDR